MTRPRRHATLARTAPAPRSAWPWRAIIRTAHNRTATCLFSTPGSSRIRTPLPATVPTWNSCWPRRWGWRSARATVRPRPGRCSTSAASCCRANASRCCSIRAAAFSSCPRWPATAWTSDADKSIPGSTVITGIGFISGVRCMVVVDDSGIMAGTLTTAGGEDPRAPLRGDRAGAKTALRAPGRERRRRSAQLHGGSLFLTAACCLAIWRQAEQGRHSGDRHPARLLDGRRRVHARASATT
jgi:hypothetical protein